MTNPFEEIALETIAVKVRVTIEVPLKLSQSGYGVVTNDDGAEMELTREQQAKLSAKDMLQYDLNSLKAGEFGLMEFLEGSDYLDTDNVTFEIIDDA
jgi:hypothetical protein